MRISKQSWLKGSRAITTYIVASLLAMASIGLIQNTYALNNCPCNIFTSSQTPVSPAVVNDNTPVTLGVRFIPNADGYITGVRFYKDVTMTDTHTGSLWDYGGNLLATGTYSGETASGWQDLTFASPVQVTAGSTYVATMYTPTGKYIANGAYFNTGISNYPLSAPGGSDFHGPAGVFSYGGDQYPSNSFNNGNYWVDVTFRQTINNTPPSVSSITPANNTGSTNVGTDVIATLNQNINPDTVTSSTVKLRDAANNDVSASVTYDDATKTITINPSAALSANSSYTASLKGGVGGIANLDGTALAADYQWSFTTGTDQCPCTVWANGSLTGDPMTFVGSPGGEVLGQKIHAIEGGYIQAVRFYKSIKNTATTHTVHVWTSGGTELATATSANESAYGWQEVQLSSPVAVNQGQDYVVSFYSSDNIHVYSDGELTNEAGAGSLRANAAGSYYENNGSDVFPTKNDGTNATANFWIDAVFTTTPAYTAPFTIDTSQPVNGSYGALTSSPITIKMSTPVDASTVAGGVRLATASGTNIPGSATYDSSLNSITFTPSSTLAPGTKYITTLSSNLKDIYGTAYTGSTISFTTGTALSTNINQGLSGPVLVVTDTSNPYDIYLAEMLRAQGINYFDVKDVSELTATLLANYSFVLLGKTTLSAGNVSSLTSWVQAGGNLIAMQPDKQLSSLLGITDQSSTLDEGYLRVDAAQKPGIGITAQTMQYHYSADVYTINSGTQTVATLYSDASTPTTNPAVVQRSVGSGHAAAFTYDLPRSIATMHQGNPAWAGQDRDGSTPIRPNDLFNGNGATDWLNVSKAYIPQADEQQRLLTNMIQSMSRDSTPLPQFWILPHGYKAALIMTEDDHGSTNSTYSIFDKLTNTGAVTCSVVDWGCTRPGSLLYTSSGLTSAQATLAQSMGFSMGVHIETGCNNFASFSALNSSYTSQLSAFRAKYTTLPNQTTNRMHCYVWSDWDSVAKADVANGIRYDLTYEWYPNSWTGSHTGYLTGSGMTMRFTDSSGSLLDVYQGVTDLDYETDPTGASVNSMLDNALNSNEFYGVLGTHYDTEDSYYLTLVAAAKSHNVPIINTEQMTVWKDAINSSSFANITSTKYKLTFTAQVAEGGNGMQAMVPTATSNGALSGITSAHGGAISYTTSTVKGVEYAIFNAQPDTYTALYGAQPVDEPATEPSTAGNAVSETTSTSFASITKPSPFAETLTGKPDSPTQTKKHTQTSHSTDTSSQKANKAADATLDLPHIILYTAGAVIVVAGVGALGWWILGLTKLL